MYIKVFEERPIIEGYPNHISLKEMDFIKLQPVMDMCRENKFTLIIDFSEE